jgi:hypothetical protein
LTAAHGHQVVGNAGWPPWLELRQINTKAPDPGQVDS